jgi:hypothetical protein
MQDGMDKLHDSESSPGTWLETGNKSHENDSHGNDSHLGYDSDECVELRVYPAKRQ